MADLKEYLSQFTGAEIDAAVLAVLANYVATFNNRQGPNIEPAKGDYDLSQITVNNQLLSSVGKKLDTLLDVLTDIRDNMTCYEETVLFGTLTTNLANGTYTLSDDITNYDALKFEVHLDVADYWEGYREHSVEEILQARQTCGTTTNLLCSGYDNSHFCISFPTNTTFVYYRYSRNYLSRIIGVKYNKKVFESEVNTNGIE